MNDFNGFLSDCGGHLHFVTFPQTFDVGRFDAQKYFFKTGTAHQFNNSSSSDMSTLACVKSQKEIMLLLPLMTARKTSLTAARRPTNYRHKKNTSPDSRQDTVR